ncbi:MAG TPA: tetratricopeptide repeat protein [Kofleriaceae bacterium]|nr:tetratricopeptide repeat protein [Kofleriaceae bacterium]
MPTLAAALTLAVLGFGASRVAIAAPDVTSKIASYESEAQALQSNLPVSPNQMSTQTGQRRLVDAQVAYASGDYNTSSLILFDLAGKTQGQDKEIATFYLAESLFQKGDHGAARSYYQAIKDGSAGSKYYQPALMRLVEIAIVENDPQGGEDALKALDSTTATPGVTYVRGKWAFSRGKTDPTKYDDALNFFNQVQKGSEYELQATYYAGTTYVAKQDLAKATDTFTNIVARTPKTNTDRRVLELAQLALGRVYYERDQAGKSIDNYLLVDRRSDLFPTALYEVAWVYVKSKQYDKALTALELLGRLDPQSTKTPTVRILEGNLRIRKAQMLRQAEINGTVNTEEKSSPAKEYAEADKIFSETHDQYAPSFQALDRMVTGALDPASFIDQISGRNERLFSSSAPIPEAAAQFLREEPEVDRVVHVETDLAEIQANITDSEAIINRLEGVLAKNDHFSLYPSLSSRRLRIAAIQHDLISIRNKLADQAGSSDPQRKGLAAQYAALGDPERAYGERTGATQTEFDKIDDSARDVDSTMMSAQAIAVALRKYSLDVDMPAAQKETMQTEIDAATKEARAIEDELADIHREVVLGKDLAGVGDEDFQRARDLRHQLKVAQDNEARVISGKNPLIGRATVLAETLEQADTRIDALAARGLDEIKAMLATERQNLAQYKTELAEYDAEARSVGAEVLAGSFKDVRAKFEDVVVRTDVGSVDVLWSEKEDSDDEYKRLNLARSRDLKQLRDEFRFVLDETTPEPAKKPAAQTPAPSPEGASPDKGGPIDNRVKPAGDENKGSTQPTVKPGAQTTPATTPKTTTPKTTGGSK